MSYYEALEDGVRVSEDKYGKALYFPKCGICGEEVLTLTYKPTVKYICKACRAKMDDSLRLLEGDAYADKQERRLERAIERIEKITDISEYKEAARKVYKTIGRPKWYQSTEEVMVILQLLKQGIKVKHQVKIGRYRADFVLPDDKIVLEVDGPIYHGEAERKAERYRDNIIILSMGPEWEIIRISTTLINQNVTKIYRAVKAIQRKRKLERGMHNGQLPRGQTNTAI